MTRRFNYFHSVRNKGKGFGRKSQHAPTGAREEEIMNQNYWIIAVVLLLLTALGGLMGQETRIARQEQQLAEAQAEQDRLAAAAYWARIRDMPRPHSPPLDGAVVSSSCGYRMDPMGGSTEGLHKGVDLVAPIGTPVRAVLDGVVVEHWPAPDGYWKGHSVFGGMIVLDHGDGLFSIYGHLSVTYVHEGWTFEAGTIIGEVGDTGISTGPHLHLEIVVDPLRYLEER
jgi:murein DD-endopeptidase MepM/ murein hydrolase activator NlpD